MITTQGRGKQKRGWFNRENSILPLPFIGVATTIEGFNAIVDDLGVHLDDAAKAESTDSGRIWPFKREDGATVYVVLLQHARFMEEKDPLHTIVGVITHEAVHLCDWILEDLGEDKVGMETRAYLTQFLAVGMVMAYQELVPANEQFGGAL